MNPRADLTISRFAESRKTIIVVNISLDIPGEMSSKQQVCTRVVDSLERMQTFEFENQPRYGGDRRADHMGSRACEATSNHREVLFQRCGCYGVGVD